METSTGTRNIVDLLKQRPVVGDGSYVFVLEKRGYVKIGPWTPEVVLEHPDAVKQLHQEYLRAGADVIQAFTFHANKSRLSTARGDYDSDFLNQRACEIALEVARPGGALVCGGLSPTNSYKAGLGKKVVMQEFRDQVQIFSKKDVDFLLAEFLAYVEETEWAIEAMKEANKPIAVTMRIGPLGDWAGYSVEECAVRMARAGADILGINCQFSPDTCLKVIKRMKDALDKEGLNAFLMVQPLGHQVPEVENTYEGYHALPEYPVALETRLLTRFEARRFAREAYELGVRYIGGCCGFDSYHIREMADELKEERGIEAPGADKTAAFCTSLLDSPSGKTMAERVGREYWMNLKPASGRPDHPHTQTVASVTKPGPIEQAEG